MEVWKDLPNFNKYQVSNEGRVKSFHRDSNGLIKKQSFDKDRYLLVGLMTNEGKLISKRVHQLVAICFLDHKPEADRIINHKDFDKTNNHLSNLEIVSVRENSNKKHLKSTSKYVGVSWHKATGKWQARIQIDGISKYLGCWHDEWIAHKMYETALRQYTKTNELVNQ
jgi:hypothetical protein